MGVPSLFWKADLWLQPSRRMLTVQNPKKPWLATRSACSWYRMPFWSHDCPLLALAALACLSPVGDGPVCSWLALLSPLFCEPDWWWLGLFVGSWDSYPTVWFVISSWFPQIAFRAFRLGPYPKHCPWLLPVPPPLASGGCKHQGCCTTENCCWACNLWGLIIYLFFLPVILPSEIPMLNTDPLERVFSGICKLLSLFLKYKLIYFNWRLITLQYCIAFAIYQHESTMGVHVFPLLNPPFHLPLHTIETCIISYVK